MPHKASIYNQRFIAPNGTIRYRSLVNISIVHHNGPFHRYVITAENKHGKRFLVCTNDSELYDYYNDEDSPKMAESLRRIHHLLVGN
jgi:hypothetical protein